MTHWYDYVFWIFFGGGLLVLAAICIGMAREWWRERQRWKLVAPTTFPPAMQPRATPTETWSLGGTGTSSSDLSGAGFDSISTGTSGSDMSVGDTAGGGGDFSGGGGDFGGAGSSGGWSD